jgi:hypothetical protein
MAAIIQTTRRFDQRVSFSFSALACLTMGYRDQHLPECDEILTGVSQSHIQKFPEQYG